MVVNPFPLPTPTWREVYFQSWPFLLAGASVEALIIVAIVRRRIVASLRAWELLLWVVCINVVTISTTILVFLLLPGPAAWLPAALGAELLLLLAEFLALRYLLSRWQVLGHLTEGVSAWQEALLVFLANGATFALGLALSFRPWLG